ncbi:MAG: CBS domain-containing protein [Alphaproteobacteria bacterium]|nr:MAG: CBS domain-containing protein [Alphaproteobacteria bacterium]
MRDWRKIVVGPEATLEETMRVIDQGAERIALVADRDDRLLGVVTDGDMRRALLRHLPLDTPVNEVMTRDPVTADINDDRDERRRLMDARKLYQLPIVTREGRIVGMDTLRDLMERPVHDNLVVLMAGGLGTRLGPLTKRAPKPLLKVGPRPILETILTSIAGSGFHRFRISVNYRAEMIERHFGDGSRFGVEIGYLREDQRLGTAGPLSLLDEPLEHPLLVMNGDILTRVNFEALMAFHRERGGRATMCVREYGYQVPFGTVSVDGDRALEIAEKPVQQFFINAGIYVLEPEVVARVPKGRYFDMPDLLQSLIEEGEKLAVFPIHEYWHDIGRPEDFDRARADFEDTFVTS